MGLKRIINSNDGLRYSLSRLYMYEKVLDGTKLTTAKFKITRKSRFKSGRKVTCTISRNGDLINHIYLQVQFPALSIGSIYSAGAVQPNNVAWTNSLGHALIRSVEVEIGGQRIDKQYGVWLEMNNPMSQKVSCITASA